MSSTHVLIVGAGAAGTAAANGLRQLGFEGLITIVHGEDVAPYNRTAVNKTLLQPDAKLDSVRTVVPTDPQCNPIAGRARALDSRRRVVSLEDGSNLEYDALLIATGATPRRLALRAPATDARRVDDRITGLRSYADAVRIRELLAHVGTTYGRPARVAVAGASLLGSETADGLNKLGHDVFLFDNATHPLRRHLGSTIAAWVATQHRDNLAALTRATVDAVQARDHGLLLGLSNGTELDVDLVIEALGVTPDVEWLGDSELALTDGVDVDDRLRAVGMDGVYAAGDLARVDGATRVEHWGHALAQGAHAARTIAHDLQLGEDPGAFAATGTYSTWLYGKGINVLGTPHKLDREVALAPPGHGAQVTGFIDIKGRLGAAVVLGPGKLANRLRPLVTAGANLDDAARVVADVLKPAEFLA